MIGKIISFAGVHSSGKTTGVFELVSVLRKNGINAWPVTDVARTARLPRGFSLNNEGTWVTQEIIAHRMCVQLLESAVKYEVVVTDRTPLDCLAYALSCGTKKDDIEYIRLKETVYNFVRAHCQVVYQLIGNSEELKNDGVRSNDLDYFNCVSDNFMDVYLEAETLLPELEFMRVYGFRREEVRQDIFNTILTSLRGLPQ